MMSSAANLNNGANDTMPGDYESWSPSQPMIPQGRTPFPQVPPASAPPTIGATGRTPFPPLPPTGGLPMRRPHVARHARRPRRHRRRPLTPEIVIDRRHRSSGGGRRVFTVPLDHRPTLGLRGPPRRCIEIERVRCLRSRRRRRSECYEYEYEYDEPLPLPTQPPVAFANPIVHPSLAVAAAPQPSIIIPTVNPAPAVATASFLSNLTPEAIDNLPRQTVHLPPIHLPGSHADTNTELDTVVFPAEIINPVDGTLSIIQANPNAPHGITTNIHPTAIAPIQPQMIQLPRTAGVPIASRVPLVSPAMASDPLMQRFQNLFQRLSLPQTQTMPPQPPNPPVIRPTVMPNITPSPNPPMIRTSFPNISTVNPTNTTIPNSSIITNTTNLGGYPPANIRPSNPLNTNPYPPANIRPTNPLNTNPYPPANIRPTNPLNTNPYRAASIASSGPFANTSYTPANTTAYRPSTFTPAAPMSNPTYRPTTIVPSDSSDIGPYQPANITPYANIHGRSNNNPLTVPLPSSGPAPYASTPSAPSNTLTPFPRAYGSSANTDNNSNQSMPSMPKSILRNTSSTAPSNTVYTRLNSPNVLPSNNIVRNTTTFT